MGCGDVSGRDRMGQLARMNRIAFIVTHEMDKTNSLQRIVSANLERTEHAIYLTEEIAISRSVPPRSCAHFSLSQIVTAIKRTFQL